MKNIFEWKTSILGLIFLAASFDYELIGYVIKVDDPKEVYFIGGLVIGIGLILAPNDIVKGLKSLIKKKSE